MGDLLGTVLELSTRALFGTGIPVVEQALDLEGQIGTVVLGEDGHTLRMFSQDPSGSGDHPSTADTY